MGLIIGRNRKARSMCMENSQLLFHEKGIIDVTNFAAKNPEDLLGYMCGCTISISADGIIRICEYDDENAVLETIPAENIIRFSDNINSHDPGEHTKVSLMTDNADYRLSFQSAEIKKCFMNSLNAFLLIRKKWKLSLIPRNR